MTPNYREREVPTTGRRQCDAYEQAITTGEHPHTAAELVDLTFMSYKEWRTHHRHTFVFNGNGEAYTLRADADRWTGDGV